MRETTIQRKIIKYLEREGHYVRKIVVANKSGTPDLLCCINGRFVAIETKTPDTKDNVSELQRHNLAKIEECGGVSMVAWTLEQIIEVIEKCL